MRTQRLRIAHALAPAPFGGLERVVRGLALGQAARGHDVSVCAVLEPGSEDHPFLADFEDSGVALVPVTVERLEFGPEIAAVHGAFHSRGADLLHTHGYRTDVVDGWTAARQGIPVISTVHGFTRGGGKNRLYEHLQKLALRQFDRVVAVSRPLANELIESGVPRTRVRLIPNAWSRSAALLARADARRKLGMGTSDRLLVGWVGRLSVEKGPDVLLDALPALRGEGLLVAYVGDGPDRPALEERARRLGVSPLVQWAGAVRDAATLYSAFDAFVLSSRTEGTPMVLFEAMDAGVPIVATTVGGVPDVVSESEALLVPAEDPAALSRALRTLLRDPASARERARSARQRLTDRYSADAWLDRYDECYRSVLGARRVPAPVGGGGRRTSPSAGPEASP